MEVPPSGLKPESSRVLPSRREQLQSSLAEFEKTLNGPHDEFAASRAHIAICLSIATILDVAGLGTPASPEPAPALHEPGKKWFMVGNRQYLVSDGEFPEYDTLLKFQMEQTAINSKRPQQTTSASLRFSEEFIEQVRARVAEALQFSKNP